MWDTSSSEALGFPAQWSRQYDTPTLTLQAPKDSPPIGLSGWEPPACWSKKKALPTQTMPAETAEGRLAPRSAKGRAGSATHQRWEDGGKQYAPWHYQAGNMCTRVPSPNSSPKRSDAPLASWLDGS